MHGAGAPQVRRAAARRVAHDQALEAARSELARVGGGQVAIDPVEGLISLWETAMWNVVVYTVAIEGLLPRVDRESGVAIPERVIEFEKGGTHVPAAMHVLVEEYGRWVDRAAKLGKMCHDVGIDETRVKIAASHMTRLGDALDRAVNRVALPAAQRAELMAALADELRREVG